VKPSFYKLWGLSVAIAIITTWVSMSQRWQSYSWSFKLGMPGSILSLYIGWFLPIASGRLVYFGLPFLINASAYYMILRAAFAIRKHQVG
jgi:hypothetical protein